MMSLACFSLRLSGYPSKPTQDGLNNAVPLSQGLFKMLQCGQESGESTTLLEKKIQTTDLDFP